jgi:hypothetical protein
VVSDEARSITAAYAADGLYESRPVVPSWRFQMEFASLAAVLTQQAA